MIPASVSREAVVLASNGPRADREFESYALLQLPELYQAAIALLGSPAEAEKAVQESYLQTRVSSRRARPSRCRAQLFRVLFRAIANRRKKVSDNIPHATEDKTIAALRRLPQDLAEVVLLADVQDFSFQEIQDALRLPLEIVMSRLNRARLLLQPALAE